MSRSRSTREGAHRHSTRRTQALSEHGSEGVRFCVDICLCRKSLVSRPVRHNGLSDGDDTGNRFGTRDDPGELVRRPAAAG
jgi:hypothetical protein